ncbi:MAG: NAD(P)H-hydrate dehydratase [candidate division WOR-3 bacterium]|jgi:NAD(P)H-hydrate epimerase|nr:NAD(P)H-hydrate dehydratase [candidate division WOR-3 bacterium]
MIPLIPGSLMKEIDRKAIENWGISGLVLMENAGRAVVDFIEEEVGKVKGKKFVVVCGKGNNGGDGFVITRHLLNRDARVDCILLGERTRLKGDARTNAEILRQAGIPIRETTHPDEISSIISTAQFIVDAIFGTGLSAPPTDIFAQTIQLINESAAYVISVDLPSGLDADTGKVFGTAVKANLTVTMGAPKYGLVLYPGKIFTGKLRIADIGIPKTLIEQHADTFLVTATSARQHLPPRRPDGHKGTFGTCLVIAGARGYSGAACLTAMAAVRAGAGLVRLAFPRSLAPVIEAQILEPVKHPLPETADETLSPEAANTILELAAGATSIAIGPGITTQSQTKTLIREILPRLSRPVVLDADGINNLVGAEELIPQCSAPIILTPHPGELSRLIGIPPDEINTNRIEIARTTAKRFNCVLVLKGAPTVTATPQGRVFVNPTGNSGLGSGGTGDILTGLIAGLLAQGASPLDAALTGVFLHGRAADLAVQELSEYSLCARDLLQFLPRAFTELLSC